MRLQTYCPQCYKPLHLTSKEFLADTHEVLSFYKCGHFGVKAGKAPVSITESDFISLNGEKKAYPYQQEFLDWFFNTSASDSALNADQMGLGKTVQALLALRKYRSLSPENSESTALLVVPGSTIWQWFNQYKTWCDPSLTGIFMIAGSKAFIPPGFKTYIIGMDTFSRLVKTETNPYGRIINQWIEPSLKALNIRFLITDEVQKFKDQSSARAKALVCFCKNMDIKKKIFLSGTPIKNRADEYFTVLNLIDPEEFASIEDFRRKWLMQDDKGRWSLIHHRREAQFHEQISQYVLRREVLDVKKDLPAFRRTFTTVYLENEEIKKQYNKELKNLDNIVNSTAKFSFRDVNDSLMTLRRLCGIGKISFAADYIETFLESGSSGSPELGIAPEVGSEKIAIGVHHEAVRNGLFLAMKERGIPVLQLSGEDSSEQKYRIVQEFRKPGKMVLIISTLAGGVGVDGLQVCSNVLNLERQWNSVDEEQFEARFWRDGQTNPVLSDYMICKGTIDEWLTELVEYKRHIFEKTVGNNWDIAGDVSMLKELVGKILGGRLTL